MSSSQKAPPDQEVREEIEDEGQRQRHQRLHEAGDRDADGTDEDERDGDGDDGVHRVADDPLSEEHGQSVERIGQGSDELHGEGAWDTNPEVVALTFRHVLANIDAPEARAA